MKNFKPKTFNENNKKVIVFQGLCKGCGICIEKCPFKAINFSKKDLGVYGTPSIEIDMKKCAACGLCEINCPDSALRIKKVNNHQGWS